MENFATRRPLHGGLLLLARTMWLLMAALILGLFLVGIPAYLHALIASARHAQQALDACPPSIARTLLTFLLSADIYPVFDLSLEIALVVLLTLVSFARFWHQSDDWVVMLFSLGYLTFGTYITDPLRAVLTVSPLWRLPINIIEACGAVFVVLMFFRFPDGRFVPAWTRPLALLCVVWNAAWVLFPGLPFNASDIYTLSWPALLVLLLWIGGGILALHSRYRQLTSHRLRLQTRLFTISAVVGVTAYAAYAVPLTLIPMLSQPGVPHALYSMIGLPLFLVSAVLVPFFLFVSIQRYHLFNIDVLINRTLRYGALTGSLALVYFSLVFMLQIFLRGVIRQPGNLVITISTLAVALLFQPLRRRIQRVIDGRFYRSKYDAAQTLAALGATLRSEVDLDQLCEHLAMVVQDTMQPAHISVWLCKHDPLPPSSTIHVYTTSST